MVFFFFNYYFFSEVFDPFFFLLFFKKKVFGLSKRPFRKSFCVFFQAFSVDPSFGEAFCKPFEAATFGSLHAQGPVCVFFLLAVFGRCFC